MRNFGKRGGSSPTAGRKATVYEGTFPDGNTFTKRAFFTTGPAFASCYEHNGIWHCAGIHERATDINPRYVAIPVKPVE